MYQRVVEHLVEKFGEDLPTQFWNGINTEDSGNLYTYFISDFATTSRARLEQLRDGAYARNALRSGALDAEIGPSEIAGKILDEIIQFLFDKVFSEPRVRNRRTMLETVAIACLDLLYNDISVMESILVERATLERWTSRIEEAQSLLNDDIHRIQMAVDILAEMGDQEIYDFVGIQSL
jgi:hypothetical protein